MNPFDLATPSIAAYAVLSAMGLAGCWLAVKGVRFDMPWVDDAVSAALDARGVKSLDPLYPYLMMVRPYAAPSLTDEALRSPLPRVIGPEHGDLGIAVYLLLSALDRPDAPEPAAVEAMNAARRKGGRRVMPPLGFGRRTAKAFDDLMSRHAWTETLLVELMVRCRDAGSWISPAHLDPFVMERHDLASALRAGRDGAVAPDGAAIIAHWMAERSAGRALLVPRTAAAAAAIEDAGE